MAFKNHSLLIFVDFGTCRRFAYQRVPIHFQAPLSDHTLNHLQQLIWLSHLEIFFIFILMLAQLNSLLQLLEVSLEIFVYFAHLKVHVLVALILFELLLAFEILIRNFNELTLQHIQSLQFIL
jgi:hypothetical protein